MEEQARVCSIIDQYLEIFGNRWNLLILYELYNGPKRFNELRKSLSPITQTVLTRHLRSLMESDVIERVEIKGTTSTVFYAISKSGYTMIPSMINSYNWITEHMDS